MQSEVQLLGEVELLGYAYRSWLAWANVYWGDVVGGCVGSGGGGGGTGVSFELLLLNVVPSGWGGSSFGLGVDGRS